ncbi:imelysin family protein [Aureivirga sp. CE67]|uniref:imelysin family protein n=1 Tax=Aureivirga sp. CE67 TaxID=1788983 RepID=UPI0018C979E3|nr:imelysin family protein [Aureivirga sp. CE67]
MKLKHISKTFIAFFSLFALTLAISCSEDDSVSQETLLTNERAILLTNIYENNISTLVEEVEVEINKLEVSANTFIENRTVQNLESLQAEWKNAIADWKQLEVYNITQLGLTVTYYNVHFAPVNHSIIEEKILGTETIDNALIKSLGSNAKGFTSLEYLLFSEDNTALISDFTTAEKAERRVTFLKETILELKNTFTEIKNKWMFFKADFIGDKGTGVTSMQSQVINNMITALEIIKVKKLEKPFQGLEEAESPYSDYSIEIIQKELEATKQLFLAFDNYLNILNEGELSSDIKNKFDLCITAANDISSLNSSIENGDTKINTLVQKIKDLLLVVKIDMAAATKTTVTFNDTDGD